MFKRATLAMATIFMIMLYGCNGDVIEGNVNLDCGPDVEMTFEDWRSWWKVNQAPLVSEGHSNSHVDVYVDDLAKETYLTMSAPFPECARIVKAKYTDASATEVEVLGIMVKMPEGYDPDHNDWWYARYDPTGKKALAQGKTIFECRACHQQASGTDYLFSEEVMTAANN
jgi:hypothetical protein